MPITPGWGTITLGRLSLRETFAIAEDDSRIISITGETSVAGLTGKQVERIYHDLLSLANSFVPITFSQKNFLSGYYTIQTVKVDYADYTGPSASAYAQPVVLNWQIAAMRVGPATIVDIESRLSGPQTRKNDFSLLGEIVHAPPAGHYSYIVENLSPSTLTRLTSEGTITLYRGIPQNTHPRYCCALENFGGGRCRFIDAYGEERSGIERNTPTAGWQMTNGIIRVMPALVNGVLVVSSWTVAGWRSRTWDITKNNMSIGPFTDIDILHNEYDTLVVRMTKSLSPGRITVDALIRRGGRTVELYIISDTGAKLGVKLGVAELGTASTVGVITSVGEDDDGGRFVVGSARSFDNDLANGGLSISTATELDVFIGAVPAATPINSNYSFESGTTGWTAIGGTLAQESTIVKYGTKSGKLTTDGIATSASVRSTNMAITPVTGYTFAGWVYCPHGRPATVLIEWLNAGGSVVSSKSTPLTLRPSTWLPYIVEASSPPTATQVRYSVVIQQTTPWTEVNGHPWNTMATWDRPVPFVETVYVDALAVRRKIDGDTVADMMKQSLGNCSEIVQGVKR